MKSKLDERLTAILTCFIADYVILHAAETVTHGPAWRDVSPDNQEQILFEERHLRYISPLGKVRLHTSNHCLLAEGFMSSLSYCVPRLGTDTAPIFFIRGTLAVWNFVVMTHWAITRASWSL